MTRDIDPSVKDKFRDKGRLFWAGYEKAKKGEMLPGGASQEMKDGAHAFKLEERRNPRVEKEPDFGQETGSLEYPEDDPFKSEDPLSGDNTLSGGSDLDDPFKSDLESSGENLLPDNSTGSTHQKRPPRELDDILGETETNSEEEPKDQREQKRVEKHECPRCGTEIEFELEEGTEIDHLRKKNGLITGVIGAEKTTCPEGCKFYVVKNS
ncbi:MAG: hypothetical protein ABEK04_02105 [Candidatus Nanohalobium sp.]